MKPVEIASPCINICRMDGASGLCIGCLRSLEEIARWSRAGDDDKRTILAAVGRRREDQRAVELRGHGKR